MSSMQSFEMDIENVFQFANGTTMLVGRCRRDIPFDSTRARLVFKNGDCVFVSIVSQRMLSPNQSPAHRNIAVDRLPDEIVDRLRREGAVLFSDGE